MKPAKNNTPMMIDSTSLLLPSRVRRPFNPERRRRTACSRWAHDSPPDRMRNATNGRANHIGSPAERDQRCDDDDEPQFDRALFHH
jgi:hypothetical protein